MSERPEDRLEALAARMKFVKVILREPVPMGTPEFNALAAEVVSEVRRLRADLAERERDEAELLTIAHMHGAEAMKEAKDAEIARLRAEVSR